MVLTDWIDKQVLTSYGYGVVVFAKDKDGECVLTVRLHLCRSRIEVLANEVEVKC